jgi:hypothetical protein
MSLALALAFQAAPTADGVDPEVSAAGQAWAQCTRRVIDATIGSRASNDELVDGAFAGCAAEEAAVRAAAARALGAESVESFIDQVKSDAREVILGFLRRERRRS